MMNGARAGFLAGPGFAQQKHGSIASCKQWDLADNREKSRIPAYQLGQTQFQRQMVANQIELAEAATEQPVDAALEFFRAGRPEDEVVRRFGSELEHLVAGFAGQNSEGGRRQTPI